ncbi:hypothetical protein [Sutcliffiella sp. BMC8]|uniref:hypothetical protein n=1 Tax=Sutcliffiella sp. BMC8 TaxID=3073243 RepID=UPI0030CC53A4
MLHSTAINLKKDKLLDFSVVMLPVGSSAMRYLALESMPFASITNSKTQFIFGFSFSQNILLLWKEDKGGVFCVQRYKNKKKTYCFPSTAAGYKRAHSGGDGSVP